MGFTRLSSELSAKQSIELDNIFVLELMPFAPEGYTMYTFTEKCSPRATAARIIPPSAWQNFLV